MRKLIVVTAVLGLALTAAGCTHVRSSAGGHSGMANDAWFTESFGLGWLLPFSTKVYYCPPMGGSGASTCMEAEMIESGQPAAPAGGEGEVEDEGEGEGTDVMEEAASEGDAVGGDLEGEDEAGYE